MWWVLQLAWRLRNQEMSVLDIPIDEAVYWDCGDGFGVGLRSAKWLRGRLVDSTHSCCLGLKPVGVEPGLLAVLAPHPIRN